MSFPVKLLCGLEASHGPVQEVLSSVASVTADALESSDDLDPEEDGENDIKGARKKKNKRRKGELRLWRFSNLYLDACYPYQSLPLI